MLTRSLSPLHLAFLSLVLATLAGCQGAPQADRGPETSLVADGPCATRDVAVTAPETGEPVTRRRRLCGAPARAELRSAGLHRLAMP